MRIVRITQSEIEVLKDRESVVFRASGNGLYVNSDSQVTISDEGTPAAVTS